MPRSNDQMLNVADFLLCFLQVQNLLQQMQSRFQTMSDSIITKIDEMGNRIDELEQSINDLRTEIGVESSPSPSAPLKAKDDTKSEE
ncbi:heat shock factor-binding protein isoform X1 [Mercurialis annua]|uniref:heat shock factor-binding protein isoform X1 n=1 Tax=Mercurialis annua TaxID=3986 RepID=UPI0024ACE961|nr:heat shock factor-binding protein isoform X1 [Mercurialis annua]